MGFWVLYLVIALWLLCSRGQPSTPYFPWSRAVFHRNWLEKVCKLRYISFHGNALFLKHSVPCTKSAWHLIGFRRLLMKVWYFYKFFLHWGSINRNLRRVPFTLAYSGLISQKHIGAGVCICYWIRLVYTPNISVALTAWYFSLQVIPPFRLRSTLTWLHHLTQGFSQKQFNAS